MKYISLVVAKPNQRLKTSSENPEAGLCYYVCSAQPQKHKYLKVCLYYINQINEKNQDRLLLYPKREIKFIKFIEKKKLIFPKYYKENVSLK